MEDFRFLKESYIDKVEDSIKHPNIGSYPVVERVMCRDSLCFIVDISPIEGINGVLGILKRRYRSLGLSIETLDKYTLVLYLDLTGYYNVDGCDFSCLEILFNSLSQKYKKKTGGELIRLRVEKNGYNFRTIDSFDRDNLCAMKVKRGFEDWLELCDIRSILYSLGEVSLVRKYNSSGGYMPLYYPIQTKQNGLILYV